MSRAVYTFSLASGDTSTAWVAFSPESAHNAVPRSFSGALTSGDTIYIDVTNDEDPNTTLTTYNPSTGYTDVNFGGVIEGRWNWIRIRKTGTTGASIVSLRL